ncbi:MAG: hypothetical protein COU69_01500 [Candidatus Pacebacteria bacterium CG10_big_fil_rev_8_21_14_0_10_56_10]|nr:MAG: hypothetical protein COU69_01500 [Candidatus Pacebacteria bacterium CG10_big_fil_rev_8_21_14_0_10_56_10]
MLAEPTRALLRRAIIWVMSGVAVLLVLSLAWQWLPRQRSVNTGGGVGEQVSPADQTAQSARAGPATPAPEASEPAAAAAQPPAPNSTVKLLLVGDMMFDRDIRLAAERHPDGYDFILAPVRQLLTDHDLVIGNLEGPVTTFKSRSAGSAVGSTDNFLFTFSTKVPALLARHQMRLVNLGNNHIGNFGPEGIAQTGRLLDLAQVEYFGCIGQPRFDAQRCLRQVEVGGLRLLFVNHNQFAEYDRQRVLEELRRRVAGQLASQTETAPTAQPDRPPDLTIVYAHWGSEYVTKAGPTVQDLARAYVDAGADLVVGSHPHVVQQSDQYQGVPIYYSLGNFVFDQYFDENVRRGLALTVEVDPVTTQFTLREHQLELRPNGQTVLTDSNTAAN